MVASTLYLDPSIQAVHASPKKIQDTAVPTATTGGDIERATGEEVRGIGSLESSPAGQVVEAKNVVREGPVVVMSDANGRSPRHKKGKRGARQDTCGTCCVG